MPNDDAQVERVAKAIYLSQVKHARESVDAIQFKLDDFSDIFSRLSGESETAQILIFSSFLEDKMMSLIKLRLWHLNSTKSEDVIFGSNGPLGTFGSRLALSFHLGWLSPIQHQKLTAFRKIRNEFAHGAYKVSLSDKRISNLLTNMNFDLEVFLLPIRDALMDGGKEDRLLPFDEISPNRRFLCNLAILAQKTFIDFLVLPSVIAYKVDPRDIVAGFDEGPENIRSLQRALARAVLELLAQ